MGQPTCHFLEENLSSLLAAWDLKMLQPTTPWCMGKKGYFPTLLQFTNRHKTVVVHEPFWPFSKEFHLVKKASYSHVKLLCKNQGLTSIIINSCLLRQQLLASSSRFGSPTNDVRRRGPHRKHFRRVLGFAKLHTRTVLAVNAAAGSNSNTLLCPEVIRWKESHNKIFEPLSARSRS